MYYDKKKYEEKIKNSPLFSLERGTSAYEQEMYNMEGYIFCYLMVVNEPLYEPWGCEIMETTIRCIRSYDPAKGEFLHYFNAAWKTTYKRLLGLQKNEEQFRGINIPKEDLRNIRNYFRLLETSGISVDRPDACERIAEALGLPVQKIIAVMQMSDVSVFGDSQAEETGDVWARIAGGVPADHQFLSEEGIKNLLDVVDFVFKGLQDRQKPLLSELLTARICPALQDCRVMERFSFVDTGMVETYIRTGGLPTQKSLACKYGRDAASISRTLNHFLKRLRTQMERGSGGSS